MTGLHADHIRFPELPDTFFTRPTLIWTLDNGSGTAFRNARLEAFSDYHLYALGRKTTINNNETKQASMLAGTGFPIQKRYVVNGIHLYYRNNARPGAP